ncbi:Indoleamine 2,3-dioxygenase 2 [Hondaea fermentalgiana]|uniref:Indoleamine 2,3-dioxygenase 2 n=1 Tax=Hondaea fermentalgiana TaxID=2315210 RepID=A0A2R5GK60_9STRA|nr:Indoleamine 2,3-dioxygenase 2 [Hondaea fermentalgiana]|eukprot:GBG28254.1 Indoleamine 2,3-dioxygenase 2 [Hondaea fermentalgiana]
MSTLPEEVQAGVPESPRVPATADRARAALAARWELDLRGGFLPLDTPETLPGSAFAGWEALMKKLPEIGADREEIFRAVAAQSENAESVEVFLRCCERRFLIRAHVVFGFIVHVIVNGPSKEPWEASDEIPVELAEPFMIVNERLGLPGICCSCTYDTFKWKLRDPSGPVCLDNLETSASMSGETAEEAFHLTAAMHGDMADAMFDLLQAPEHVRDGDMEALKSTLRKVRGGLLNCIKIFKVMVERLEPDSFEAYRPYMQGFNPNGVVFARREGPPSVVVAKGASAGQTAMFFLIDAALDVHHVKSAGAFANEMLDYIPSKHRECVIDFRERLNACGSLREIEAIHKEYKSAINALHAFRAFHQRVVLAFLSKVAYGTGASDFRVLLQEALDQTK